MTDTCALYVNSAYIAGNAILNGFSGPKRRHDVRAPACSKCGVAMKLVSIEAAYFYRELNQLNYACECGETVISFAPR
jgi:hypothetical protein